MFTDKTFFNCLTSNLPEIVKKFPTPFYAYWEQGIRDAFKRLNQAFSWNPGYKQFFAVKANPNLHLLRIAKECGAGFDCSSIPELIMASAVGAKRDEVIFTSNNTTAEEYQAAVNGVPEYLSGENFICPRLENVSGGGMLNLDDISYVAKAANALGGQLPELVFFRYNPGRRLNRGFEKNPIGTPVEQKYGVPHGRLSEAFRLAKKYGAKRFGLHIMVCSNKRDWTHIFETVKTALSAIEMVNRETKERIDYLNIGGGFGIPYEPSHEEFDLDALSAAMEKEFVKFASRNAYFPILYTECGRYVTGPSGVLVTKVLNVVRKYRDIIGVDAGESCIMRPMLYGSYHGILLPTYHRLYENAESLKSMKRISKRYDVAGSLCENVFLAKNRLLPPVDEGQYMFIENGGAHGYPLTITYNGRLRPAEVLLGNNGARLIRRAETHEDYFATQNFAANIITFKQL